MLQTTDNFFENISFSLKSIGSINIYDVLDILIVAYLSYVVILWVKETHAWSLLRGFLVVLAVSIFAYIFHLSTVTLIIRNTFSVGLIALVVIFQPELRSALEKLGKGGLIKNFSSDTPKNFSKLSLDEVTTAVLSMSKVRTGALILIEQDQSLEDLERTGIQIDAEISRQLLLNIFENKTPLHDGAVIIKNNRIAAATCILPLSSEDIDKQLGTRHRAALGVSEVSDAFVIVVSEETGDISISHEGKLHRKLSEEKIREMLATDEDNKKKSKLMFWKGESENDEQNS